MASPVSFTVDTSRLSASVARFSVVANTDLQSAWLRAMRTLARYIQGITPPGNGSRGINNAIGLDREAQVRGMNAISRDLSRIFNPIALKGQAKERYPDPASIHRARLAASGGKSKVSRGRKQPYFVDERKINILRKTLESHVGQVAAQWNPGLEALGLNAAAWVRKQSKGSSQGSATRSENPLSFKFEMAAHSMPDAFVSEVDRRARYALQYTENSLQRQMDAILARQSKKT